MQHTIYIFCFHKIHFLKSERNWLALGVCEMRMSESTEKLKIDSNTLGTYVNAFPTTEGTERELHTGETKRSKKLKKKKKRLKRLSVQHGL